MVNIENVFLVDMPKGCRGSKIPENNFGVRIRMQMRAQGQDGMVLMKGMIGQLKEGKVTVVELMNQQNINEAYVDFALVFSGP